ncbi:hypothetical protein BJV82DRAFT_558153 [Fennellomyces sp. T-0311]|nr:hypothetical protein BJV82DRAFT_558153 [Fennellomyces sp. T-0311]
MLSKLFIIASIGLAAVNAQFKDTYPAPYEVPTPKAEWLDLIKGASISNAPILEVKNGVPVQPSGVSGDPNCVWTFTQCLGPNDVTTCPPKQWSITFDDGPSEYTPKLLDYLKSINQKVTFFVVGTQVLSYPDVLKRAYDEGHEIAMHSWSHKNMASLTNEQIVAELKWNEQIIKEVIGVSPRFFRPPFGNIDNRVRDICKALGFTPVIWSVDTNDWYLTEHADSFSVKTITDSVSQWASTAATKGGNSLSHDLYKETVDAAIEYIPDLVDAFALSSVGQCNGLTSYKEGAGNIVPNPAASGGNATATKSADANSPSGSVESQSKDKDGDKDGDKKEDGESKDSEDADSDSAKKDIDESAATRFTSASSAALMLGAVAALFIAN